MNILVSDNFEFIASRKALERHQGRAHPAALSEIKFNILSGSSGYRRYHIAHLEVRSKVQLVSRHYDCLKKMGFRYPADSFMRVLH